MVDEKDALTSLRHKIDSIDGEILNLLNERASCVSEIGQIKQQKGMDFHVPHREREIFERLSSLNKGPFPDEAIKSIFREIISASLALEQPLKVAYLGPQATFAHLASIQHFGLSAHFIQKRTIAEIFDEVERGRAHYGVAPIENSTEGVVSYTLDTLVDSEVKICAEIVLEISHHLVSKTGKLENVTKIYSHPQALAQCRKWLESNLPDVPAIDVESTALAAQMASDDSTIAAIASEFAVTTYNLHIVQRKIEDNANNSTRFSVIGRKIPERTGNDKTSILFSLKDEVGTLYHILEPFSKNGINLTKIESRPQKKKAWEYIFFVDMEGHIADKQISNALDEVAAKANYFKILGSYPRADHP
ncbi:MAG: prephenate dehydratase [Thermodesulfobacteriota bacterium]|nr:prephenate dehydratase [Thermodesulfobacteriota bacterium]